MVSPTAPLDLTLSDLEKNNGHSDFWEVKFKVIQISKATISQRSSGHKLLVKH